MIMIIMIVESDYDGYGDRDYNCYSDNDGSDED